MSHIVLKKVQQSLMTSAIPSHVKLFSNLDDNGTLYLIDDSGNLTSIGGSGSNSGIQVEEKTYSQLWTLSQNDMLGTGSYYLITDFESRYDQPDFHFDGTPKKTPVSKGKPSAIWYQPILVQATSMRDISLDAYQPYSSLAPNGYPLDKIKYDFTYNQTEVNGTFARGRIIERIDERGNRTDFDHKTIRLVRYRSYSKGASLTGTITGFDCTNGVVTGNSTLFTTELTVGDVIYIDSYSVKSYDIKLMVKTINSNTNIEVHIDSSYSGGIPLPNTLLNGYVLTPKNYSFSGQNFDFYDTTDNGVLDSYKEYYFGQRSVGVNGVDYDDEVYPTNNNCYNNKFGDYWPIWKRGLTYFINTNNALGDGCINNTFGDGCYNNDFGDSSSNNVAGNNFHSNIIGPTFVLNKIGTNFHNNVLSFDFNNNTITQSFYNNDIKDTFEYNIISGDFYRNSLGKNFRKNKIYDEFSGCRTSNGFTFNEIHVPLQSENFTISTYVYMGDVYKKIAYTITNVKLLFFYDGAGNLANVTYLA